MLTVQPIMKNTYFTRRMTPEEIREQMEYEQELADLKDQKREIESLADNEDIKFPKIAKKAIEGTAIVATGAVGTVATGYGAKTGIRLWKKMVKTPTMISIKKYFKSMGKFIKDIFKAVKTKFFESDIYKMPANSIKKGYNKFGQTKFGKPIVKFLNKSGNKTKTAYKDLAEGIADTRTKIKNVKPETYEKAIVNTVDISGGAASAITAVKEKSEAEEE